MNDKMRIISRGELGYRLTQSFSRLESEHYLPNVIWSKDDHSWPGDWEGRTILGLVGLGKSTGKEPSYLEEIIELLPTKLNEYGYMGEIYPDGQISEQQLAGNSWLLRGLIEYTYWKKTKRLMGIIEKMVRALYLPLREEINDYPIERYEKEGNYSGSIIAIRGKWLLSTDMGCAYISMDGISAAYELLGWKELGELLNKMISKFSSTNIYDLLYQTHATLSAVRGIIRTYKITNKEEYLEIAESIFALYLKAGQTENFSNQNRFQTCDWTEPCGIVDSFICCIELYKFTKKVEYIVMAHKIYFNAICHSQLSNGGFGLERAVMSNEDLCFTKNPDGTVTEAFWCCTMRGADGLSYVSQNQILCENNELTYLNYFDSEVSIEDITVKAKSYYPSTGKVVFDISGAFEKNVKLNLFIPDYAEVATVILDKEEREVMPLNGFVRLEISKECKLVLSFDIPLIKTECTNPKLRNEFYKMMHGYLLLGKNTNTENTVCEQFYDDKMHNDKEFVVLNRTVFQHVSHAENENVKILFRKG